jgi:hypothetical protein
MAACAAGELLTAYIDNNNLPAYAPAFHLDRYLDEQYLKLVAESKTSGQL